MTLNYGYTHSNKQPCIKTYLFNFFYESIRKDITRKPKTINSGYPIGSIFLPNINENTKITLLNHTFDNDNVITKISIVYSLVVLFKDKTEKTSIIKTVNISSDDILKFGGFQTTALDISFWLKDHVSDTNDVKDVLMFYIQITRRSDESAGNESNLFVAVETVIDN